MSTQSADWKHLTRLLKILVILFIGFSSFHYIILKKVQNHPVSIPLNPEKRLYTVKEGDTLWKIAYKQYPKQDPQKMIKEIQRLNQMKTDAIKTGQPIRLP